MVIIAEVGVELVQSFQSTIYSMRVQISLQEHSIYKPIEEIRRRARHKFCNRVKIIFFYSLSFPCFSIGYCLPVAFVA